jgi:hypothetical protein
MQGVLFAGNRAVEFVDLADPRPGPGQVVVGFFYHRVYLNASYFMTAADNSPGATRDTVYEELIGPAQTRHPAWKMSDLLPWRLVKGLGIIGRYLAFQGRLARDIAAVRERHAVSRRQFDARPPASWPAEELAAWLEVNDGEPDPAVVHIRASQFANSSFATLKPGDIISTGTPPGAGARLDPPVYLKPGDVVEVSSPGIGLLRNGVMDG